MTHPLLLNLFWGIEKLKNIGPKKAIAYERIGIKNVRDLIFYFPYQVIDRRHSPSLGAIKGSEIITVMVTVLSHKLNDDRRRRRPHRIYCANTTGSLSLVYFNASTRYLEELFIPGKSLVISGKVEYNGGELQMVHPDIVEEANKIEQVKILEPVYHATYGLNSRFLGLTIQNILKFIPSLPEWIPPELMEKYGWSSWSNSIQNIHFPSSVEEISGDSKFKQRLAFDELLAKQISLSLIRRYNRQCGKTALSFKGILTQQLTQMLPFPLTIGQLKAIDEITGDQRSNYRMARLVLGDVGCGKTLVALYAMLNAVEAKKQAALMVPTEILAKQHFESIKNLCSPLGIRIALLISKLAVSVRKSIISDISMHNVDIIIGTHALFQEDVLFANLGLTVIDEQHRFGVEQRMLLNKKGDAIDFLMMSATPIPRTLCMANYGDLDLSIIHDKPLSRAPISTSIISSHKIMDFLNKIKAVLENGEKAYWICPLIEESEVLDLSYVTKRFETIQHILGPKVGMIHGKMPVIERDSVMMKFVQGEIKVLLATTVIEVGVDVPDATIMIIENAERFGLSQLHQLRGRVGRGSRQSHCILIYQHPLSKVAQERLAIIKNYNDGFKIAEEDLKIRGGGDILGTKQSGVPQFKTCDLNYHYSLIPEAYDLARDIIQEDPALTKPEHRALKLLLELYEQEDYKSYSVVKN